MCDKFADCQLVRQASHDYNPYFCDKNRLRADMLLLFIGTHLVAQKGPQLQLFTFTYYVHWYVPHANKAKVRRTTNSLIA